MCYNAQNRWLTLLDYLPKSSMGEYNISLSPLRDSVNSVLHSDTLSREELNLAFWSRILRQCFKNISKLPFSDLIDLKFFMEHSASSYNIIVENVNGRIVDYPKVIMNVMNKSPYPNDDYCKFKTAEKTVVLCVYLLLTILNVFIVTAIYMDAPIKTVTDKTRYLKSLNNP